MLWRNKPQSQLQEIKSARSWRRVKDCIGTVWSGQSSLRRQCPKLSTEGVQCGTSHNASGEEYQVEQTLSAQVLKPKHTWYVPGIAKRAWWSELIREERKEEMRSKTSKNHVIPIVSIRSLCSVLSKSVLPDSSCQGGKAGKETNGSQHIKSMRVEQLLLKLRDWEYTGVPWNSLKNHAMPH